MFAQATKRPLWPIALGKVSLSDKREYSARVVGTDSKTDLAVLKIDQTGLPALGFADSSKVQLGDVVLAVGNPLGVGQAVSMGIVSATGRGGLGIEDYEDFIQTDAATIPATLEEPSSMPRAG